MTATPLRRRRRRFSIGATLRYLVLSVIALAVLLPLIYALLDSFKPLNELLDSGGTLLPKRWSFDNYVQAWNAVDFRRYFLNTVVVVIGVVGIDAVASSMLGYVLARRTLPGAQLWQGVMGITLFIGVGTATLYARYVIAQHLGLANLLGVILVEVSTLTVIHTLLIRGYCATLPLEIEEAARIDGCSYFGVWRRIALPLMRPMLATTCLLAFQHAWNAFQIPYVFTLAQPQLQTLVIGVYSLGSSETGNGLQSYNLVLAGAAIVLVPIIILFLVAQKHFVRGLTEGAVK